MSVEKLRQLLAQAFIPLGLVAQHDRPLEQGLLEFARKLAPQIEGSQPQNVRKSIGVRFGSLDRSHPSILRWRSAFADAGTKLLLAAARAGPQAQ
jgi:hypothetical protein